MKGWKTFLFGALVAILLPLITYLDGIKQALAQCGVDPSTNTEICGLPGWVGVVIGIVIMGLRFITSTPIFKK